MWNSEFPIDVATDLWYVWQMLQGICGCWGSPSPHGLRKVVGTPDVQLFICEHFFFFLKYYFSLPCQNNYRYSWIVATAPSVGVIETKKKKCNIGNLASHKLY